MASSVLVAFTAQLVSVYTTVNVSEKTTLDPTHYRVVYINNIAFSFPDCMSVSYECRRGSDHSWYKSYDTLSLLVSFTILPLAVTMYEGQFHSSAYIY